MERKRVEWVQEVRVNEIETESMGHGWLAIPAFGPVDRVVDPMINRMLEQGREETGTTWTRNG